MPTLFTPRAVPEQPYLVRLTYDTDIQTADDGTEQRIARRTIPVREEVFTVQPLTAAESAQLDALLTGQVTEWSVPFWPDGEGTAGRTARYADDVQARRHGAAAATAEVAFRFTGGTAPGVAMPTTPEVFTAVVAPIDGSEDPRVTTHRQVDRIDSPSAGFQDYARRTGPITERTVSLWLTPASVTSLETWFHGLRGRCGAFELPTYQRDLVVLQGLTGDTLTIQACGYSSTLFPLPHRRRLALIAADGTITAVTVLDATDNGDGTETIVLDDDAPAGTVLVSLLLLVRLASDTLEIEWQPGVASTTLTVVELPAEVGRLGETVADTYLGYETSRQAGDLVELYDVEVDGTTLRYTTADTAFTFDGNSYASLVGARTGFAVGSSEGKQGEVTLRVPRDHALAAYIIGGLPTTTMAVTIRRVHRQAATDAVIPFRGNVLRGRITGPACELVLGTLQSVLGRQLPRMLTQRPCAHVHYGPLCQVVRASFTHTGLTVTDVAGRTITVTGANAFNMVEGLVRLASGKTESVEAQVGDQLTLKAALGVAVSDVVTLVEGCDHQASTCDLIFANIQNFGGELNMPAWSPFEGPGLVGGA